jgi:hypothetical protein
MKIGIVGLGSVGSTIAAGNWTCSSNKKSQHSLGGNTLERGKKNCRKNSPKI